MAQNLLKNYVLRQKSQTYVQCSELLFMGYLRPCVCKAIKKFNPLGWNPIRYF